MRPDLTKALDARPADAAPLRGRVQRADGLDARGRAQRTGGCARGAGGPRRGNLRPPTCAHHHTTGFRASLPRLAGKGHPRGGTWAGKDRTPGRSPCGADRSDGECWAPGTEEVLGSRAGAGVWRGSTWRDANVGGSGSEQGERPPQMCYLVHDLIKRGTETTAVLAQKRAGSPKRKRRHGLFLIGRRRVADEPPRSQYPVGGA